MYKLSTVHQAEILRTLVEGCSIRSTERLTGHHRDTIMRLLVKAGKKSKLVLDLKIRNIQPKHIQIDEAWTFVGKKSKNFNTYDIGDKSIGSQYVFVAIDRDTKLILAFRVGKRALNTVIPFINDVKNRIEGYTHITTDSYPPYVGAILDAFGLGEVSYAQLIKVYSPNGDPKREGYSPIDFVTTRKNIIFGNPATHQISTSHIERQNLTLRMCLRRMTRLTNGFSKKLENLNAALNLHFAYYNFCRIHGSLRITPAMKAGITSHIWSIKDILEFPN